MKFEGDKSNPLEVMISQTQEYEKAMRLLFADPVTIKSKAENNTYVYIILLYAWSNTYPY